MAVAESHSMPAPNQTEAIAETLLASCPWLKDRPYVIQITWDKCSGLTGRYGSVTMQVAPSGEITWIYCSRGQRTTKGEGAIVVNEQEAREAMDEADRLWEKARDEANRQRNEARDEADRLWEKARDEANRLRGKARAKANRLWEKALVEANRQRDKAIAAIEAAAKGAER